jgi:IS5 family transposase
LGQEAPKRSCLHDNISRVRPQTLQVLHKILVEHAVLTGVESGTAVRTDTTPVAAPLRPPSDSALLGDAVRVLTRLLRKAQKRVPMKVPNHSRRVLYRTTQLRSQRLEPAVRQAVYFDLLQDTKRYIEAALFAAEFLEGCPDSKAYLLSLQLRTQAERALCIVAQTERRVLEQESVPATSKYVSMFETHADILRKRDEVVYGHKVSLSFGKTGVVLAAQVLQGNPADATLAVPAIEQVKENTGKTPHDAAMDGGFASKANVEALKKLGVQRVAFNKSKGIDTQAACGNRRVRRKLYRFRAGAEGLISWLKRSLGMGQSRWKGEQGFAAYVWGVVVTASLQALARAG